MILQDHLVVIGLWEKDADKATITSVDRVSRSWVGDLSDELVVVALDASGREISTTKAVVYPPGCGDGKPPYLFTAAVPFDTAIDRLEVRENKTVLGAHARKSKGAVPKAGVNKLAAGTLEWAGDTLAYPDLHYHIQASNDGGHTWSTYAVNARDKSFDVESIRRDMEGRAFRVRVITTDGFSIHEEVFDYDED